MLPDSFLSKVTISSSGCWNWTGCRNGKPGYGYLTHNKKNWLAHRFAYSQQVSAIPKDKVINHKCRNKLCVNIEHLECLSREEHDKVDRDLLVEGGRRGGAAGKGKKKILVLDSSMCRLL